MKYSLSKHIIPSQNVCFDMKTVDIKIPYLSLHDLHYRSTKEPARDREHIWSTWDCQDRADPRSRKVDRKATISRHDLIHLQLTALNPLSLFITRLPAVSGLHGHLYPRILLLQNAFPKGREQPH